VNVHVPVRTTYPPCHVSNTIDPYGCVTLCALLFDKWTVLGWRSACNLEKEKERNMIVQ